MLHCLDFSTVQHLTLRNKGDHPPTCASPLLPGLAFPGVFQGPRPMWPGWLWVTVHLVRAPTGINVCPLQPNSTQLRDGRPWRGVVFCQQRFMLIWHNSKAEKDCWDRHRQSKEIKRPLWSSGDSTLAPTLFPVCTGPSLLWGVMEHCFWAPLGTGLLPRPLLCLASSFGLGHSGDIPLGDSNSINHRCSMTYYGVRSQLNPFKVENVKRH
jgi:hypothetical protein